MVHRRHEDQEAAGQSDVRGDARALLRDGLLGDLNENLLAGLEQIADGRKVGGLHGGAATTAVAASTGAFAVACAAGVAGTIATAITAAKAAPVTSAIAAATATIALAVPIARRKDNAAFCLIDADGLGFAAFGELFVNDVFFSVGLIKIFVLVLFIGSSRSPIVGIVDAVLFFKIVLVEVLFARAFSGTGAGDLVDGHLAEHGAEVGGSFERLLLFEIVHLFNGAGVESGVVVLFVERLLNKRAGAGDEGGSGSVGRNVAAGVQVG